jgi:hypothetical protein
MNEKRSEKDYEEELSRFSTEKRFFHKKYCSFLNSQNKMNHIKIAKE